MNLKSVVVVPTFARPEFLALSLEKISQADDVPGDVRIFLDTCSDGRLDEVEFVRDHYYPTADIFRTGFHIVVPGGSWNILHALAEGYATGAELVYFVEEDVFVRPGFFRRHIELQESGDYFVTCGRKLKNRDDSYYSNPGTCYRREKLELVMPHIGLQYFADQEGYLSRLFPHMDDAGTLDDGLIRRVMQSVGGKVKCAVPAIASHCGFHYYGKFEQYKTVGSIEERISQLRIILAKVDPKDKYTSDFEVF